MTTLTIYKGLQGSGKSSKAQAVVEASKGRTKRVERDQIRSMLDFSHWSPRNEKIVVKLQREQITTLLQAGINVISSDTNLNPSVVQSLKDIAKANGAEVVVDDSFLSVSPEECIKRDLRRQNSVGADVIWKAYNTYVSPPTPYIVDPELPNAVLIDLDGTLASITHRDPFDASDAANDPVNEHVKLMMSLLSEKSEIIILSGRNDKYSAATFSFLVNNNVQYDQIFMRPDGDFRKDSVLKREFFDNHIVGKYNVVAVFDDRPQVVRLWKSLSLPVFNVGDGIEF